MFVILFTFISDSLQAELFGWELVYFNIFLLWLSLIYVSYFYGNPFVFTCLHLYLYLYKKFHIKFINHISYLSHSVTSNFIRQSITDFRFLFGILNLQNNNNSFNGRKRVQNHSQINISEL